MIRLLLRFLGIKDYEVCQSCETLKQQLLLSNQANKELTETLLSLVKPQVIHSPDFIIPTDTKAVTTFSRRRTELENAEKKKTNIIKDSPFVAKVKDLEDELGLGGEKNA